MVARQSDGDFICADGSSSAYTFDNAYRILSETRSGVNNYTHSWTYDAVGNRLTQNKDGTVTSYSYNGRNQLVTETSGTVAKKYDYDRNGNSIYVETKTSGVVTEKKSMWYDNLNRMKGWQKQDAAGTPIATETHTYRGADWHRLSTTSNSSVPISYLYDGDNVVADIAGGAATAYYVTPFLDQNLSMTIAIGQPNAGTYYYSQDGLGSVRTLTDSTGLVKNKYDYTAYGEPFAPNTSTTIPNKFTYTGRAQNAVSGLQYNRNRFYNAGVGRWTARDPIGYKGNSWEPPMVYGNSLSLKYKVIRSLISSVNALNQLAAQNYGTNSSRVLTQSANGILLNALQILEISDINFPFILANGGLYGYSGSNPARFIDPMGLLSWASWGQIATGVGVLAGAAAVALSLPVSAPAALLVIVTVEFSVAGGLSNIVSGLEDNPDAPKAVSSPLEAVGVITDSLTNNKNGDFTKTANLINAVISIKGGIGALKSGKNTLKDALDVLGGGNDAVEAYHVVFDSNENDGFAMTFRVYPRPPIDPDPDLKPKKHSCPVLDPDSIPGLYIPKYLRDR